MRLDLYKGRTSKVYFVLDHRLGWVTTVTKVRRETLKRVQKGWSIEDNLKVLDLPLVYSIDNFHEDRLEEIYQEIQMYLLME